MFTGIIEEVGTVSKITKSQSNLLITIKCSFIQDLVLNQSIAHNGICLSIYEITNSEYTVCAIKETLEKTNLKHIQKGDIINLERCLLVGSRFDGHIVQGHIDCRMLCVTKKDMNGSWWLTFEYDKQYNKYLIPKGSIAINGISLTIANIDIKNNLLSVAIIPYTFNKTNLNTIKVLDYVNVEFDIIAKQIAQMQTLT